MGRSIDPRTSDRQIVCCLWPGKHDSNVVCCMQLIVVFCYHKKSTSTVIDDNLGKSSTERAPVGLVAINMVNTVKILSLLIIIGSIICLTSGS